MQAIEVPIVMLARIRQGTSYPFDAKGNPISPNDPDWDLEYDALVNDPDKGVKLGLGMKSADPFTFLKSVLGNIRSADTEGLVENIDQFAQQHPGKMSGDMKVFQMLSPTAKKILLDLTFDVIV